MLEGGTSGKVTAAGTVAAVAGGVSGSKGMADPAARGLAAAEPEVGVLPVLAVWALVAVVAAAVAFAAAVAALAQDPVGIRADPERPAGSEIQDPAAVGTAAVVAEEEHRVVVLAGTAGSGCREADRV